MAGTNGKRMFTVDKFFGINESADGLTELGMGEASRMENFFITDAFNLTLRPGIQRLDHEMQRDPAPILATWAGYVDTKEYLLICDFKDGTDRIWLYIADDMQESGEHRVFYRQDGALGLTSAENAFVKVFTFGGRIHVMSAGNTVGYDDG